MVQVSYLSAVMHVRAEIVRQIESRDLSPRSRLKVVEFSVGDVVFVNNDVKVSVWTTLFMPESDGVADFVSDRAVLRNTLQTESIDSHALRLRTYLG